MTVTPWGEEKSNQNSAEEDKAEKSLGRIEADEFGGVPVFIRDREKRVHQEQYDHNRC